MHMKVAIELGKLCLSISLVVLLLKVWRTTEAWPRGIWPPDAKA